MVDKSLASVMEDALDEMVLTEILCVSGVEVGVMIAVD
jgi:hypothetical protein